MQPVVDVRRSREPPEVVLDEPEHRIGDDVVVAVVGLRVVRDEPQPVGRAVPRGLLDRLALRLRGDDLGPRRVIALAIHVTSWWATRLAERGDEPAAAAPSDALAGRLART